MRRPLVKYDFATAPIWISLYMRKIWFSFLSVHTKPQEQPNPISSRGGITENRWTKRLLLDYGGLTQRDRESMIHFLLHPSLMLINNYFASCIGTCTAIISLFMCLFDFVILEQCIFIQLPSSYRSIVWCTPIEGRNVSHIWKTKQKLFYVPLIIIKCNFIVRYLC